MKKQKFPTFLWQPATLVLPLFLSLIFFSACDKGAADRPNGGDRSVGSGRESDLSSDEEDSSGIKMVSSGSGLVLRESPSVNGEKIRTIPYRELVIIEKRKKDFVEISGVRGKWNRVRYRYAEPGKFGGTTHTSAEGWVFGAYLVDVKISKCLTIEEVESTPTFYLNVPHSFFLTDTYLHDRFEFHSDHTGIINKVVEGRGTADAANYSFYWKRVENHIELRTEPVAVPLVCPECDDLLYGPDDKLLNQCLNTCKEKALARYGKSDAKFIVNISITPRGSDEPKIQYTEEEMEPGKEPWPVEFQNSSSKKVIDIFHEAASQDKLEYSCLTPERL